MSAQNTGRQSPPPEEQSGNQQQSAPSSGHGVNDSSQDNQKDSKAQIEGLSSNPKGPLDDHVEALSKKTERNGS